MSPRSYNVVDTVTKPSPEEGAVQDFYGHDMLPASVYTQVTDLTPALMPTAGAGPVIQPGGLEAADRGPDRASPGPGRLVQGRAGALRVGFRPGHQHPVGVARGHGLEDRGAGRVRIGVEGVRHVPALPFEAVRGRYPIWER